MGQDDREAQEKRAASLREQIDRITGRVSEKPSGIAETEKRPPSPRDFIQRRMNELDRGENDEPEKPVDTP